MLQFAVVHFDQSHGIWSGHGATLSGEFSNPHDPTEALNDLGASGWDVVCMNAEGHYVMRRTATAPPT